MRIGILGTGIVGRTIATRVVELGHDVVTGGRGLYADVAAHGELLVNATAGKGSMAALTEAGSGHLAGKVLIDLANQLDSLGESSVDSLGERIQREFPETRVVKSLNTVTASVMVRPESVPGTHTMFVAGEDGDAKRMVEALLRSFGWTDVLDLGGIAAARGMEAYIQFWISVRIALGTNEFNVHLARPMVEGHGA